MLVSGWWGRRSGKHSQVLGPTLAAVTAPGWPSAQAAARLHVVTGKGGTGKTTVAAALALALAGGGRKVLLI